MKLPDDAPKQKSLHKKIVSEILPSFAERLKKEGIISKYDRHPFKILYLKERPLFEINPDFVVHLPNAKKVLIEIANP